MSRRRVQSVMSAVPSHDATIARLTEVLEDDRDLVMAYVFGSIAAGRSSADSDVDVAVLATEPLDAEHRRRLVRSVAGATGRPVDLVDLHDAGMPLLRTVLAEGRELFCRDRREKDRLVAKMLADVEHFLPLRRRMLKAQRDRWTD